jgi:hypothetical protein
MQDTLRSGLFACGSDGTQKFRSRRHRIDEKVLPHGQARCETFLASLARDEADPPSNGVTRFAYLKRLTQQRYLAGSNLRIAEDRTPDNVVPGSAETDQPHYFAGRHFER